MVGIKRGDYLPMIIHMLSLVGKRSMRVNRRMAKPQSRTISRSDDGVK